MTGWLDAAQAEPLFAIALTLIAYAVAQALWTAAGRAAALNPILVATALLAGLLLALGISYDAYIERAWPIHEMLGVLIVLLAVPLCRQARLIREAGSPMVVAAITGSVVAIVGALALPFLNGADASLLATIAPKSSTTAVAVQITDRLGGIPALTAVIVISTGIFGAAFGPAILDAAGVRDDRARGFALGVASHAIGTARAFQISEPAGAFASLGMILNALLSVVLVPLLLSTL